MAATREAQDELAVIERVLSNRSTTNKGKKVGKFLWKVPDWKKQKPGLSGTVEGSRNAGDVAGVLIIVSNFLLESKPFIYEV